MRKPRMKAIALVLCSALVISVLSFGSDGVFSSAAQNKNGNKLTIKTEAATGGSVEDATPTPEVTEPATGGTATPQPTAPTTNGGITTGGAITGSSVYAVGAEFKKGDFKYSVTKEPTETTPGRVKVIYVVEASRAKTTLKVPASFETKGYTYDVVAIAKNSFKKCTALSSVTLGKNIKYIYSRAFQGLTTLKTVNLGSGVKQINLKAFAGCKGLRKITIAKNVQKINTQAFYNCTKLKAVIVNSRNITTVKPGAFSKIKKGCTILVPSGKSSKYKKLMNAASNISLSYRTY